MSKLYYGPALDITGQLCACIGFSRVRNGLSADNPGFRETRSRLLGHRDESRQAKVEGS
jgi:hypothetical protein